MAERVLLEVSDGIATATLNRPDKHNGLDLPMFEGLAATAEELRDRDDVRVVILHGDGPSFCAGLDVKGMAAEGEEGQVRLIGGERDEDGAVLAQRVATAWLHLPMPVIAAIHGHVLGGGFQIALGADLRIAAPDVQMSVMEIVHGLIPDMGSSVTFPRLMRLDVAKELTWSGRRVGAEEALQLGLVTRISDDPLADAREMAAAIAEKRPEAIRSAKRLLNEAWDSGNAPELLLTRDRAPKGADRRRPRCRQLIARPVSAR